MPITNCKMRGTCHISKNVDVEEFEICKSLRGRSHNPPLAMCYRRFLIELDTANYLLYVKVYTYCI